MYQAIYITSSGSLFRTVPFKSKNKKEAFAHAKKAGSKYGMSVYKVVPFIYS